MSKGRDEVQDNESDDSQLRNVPDGEIKKIWRRMRNGWDRTVSEKSRFAKGMDR